ncbi:MAG: hypothetical protein ACYDD2_07050 [Candidatus Acidiferrales bacterium]
MNEICQPELHDPRGYRVRFLRENFIHLIQLKDEYGNEPRNARIAIEGIRTGRIQFAAKRFDPQRTAKLSWAAQIALSPDFICSNWHAMGRGDEAYIRNFGTDGEPNFSVMVCEVLGTLRQVVTIFPRERIGEKERRAQNWP